MADVIVGTKITADASQATESVKSFKAQLKEAQADVVKMGEKFGETSKQAFEAAKKAALLKDKISDAKTLTDSFNPDQKFKALGSSLTGVLGGFTAMTGAMGLLGVKSEEVQKQLLKVQSALAVSQGLNQLGDSIASMKTFGSVLFQTLGKGGVIGLAIAGVVALGAVIVTLINRKDEATESARKLEKQTRKQFDASLKAIEGFDLEERKLRALGKAEDYIIQKKKEKAIAALKASDAELLALQKVLEATEKSFQKRKESTTGNAYAALTAKIFGVGATKKEVDQVKEDITALGGKRNELSVLILELEKKEKDIINKPDKDKQNILTSAQRKVIEAEIKLQAEYDLLTRKNANQAEVTDTQTHQATMMELTMQFNNGLKMEETILTQFKKKNAEARKKIDDEEFAAKQLMAGAVSNILMGVSELAGQQTATGKALAVASATIDTYASIAKTLRAFSGLPIPGYAIAQAIATGIFGLIQVKKILSVKVPGGGGGGSVSGGSVSAPAAQLPQATQTLLDNNQLNQIGNAASRAFVVESDVSNNQERIRRLNRAARL